MPRKSGIKGFLGQKSTTEDGAARYIESIRLNVDARIIMSMLVSYYVR